MIKLQKIIFSLIILLAIILRIYLLDQNPPSLFADEVDVGYQAYSLLKTGRDYSGNSFPISFQSFADFRTPLYIYSVVPAVKIFGLNEMAVRLPAAIFGVIGVLGIYFLVRELGFSVWIGLISSLLLAISPWHLHYSRSGFEVTLMMALLIWALVYFLKGLKRKKLLLISSLLFSLVIYSYSTAKLFVPIFILGLGYLYKETILKISKNWFIGFFAVLLLVGLPFLVDLKSGRAIYRFSYTSIFADPTIPQEIDVKRLTDSEKVTIESKIAHNKLLSLADLFIKNYLNSFSTNFLFLQGDPIGRHSVGKMGELYVVEILTIITGLFWLCKKYGGQKKLILFWLVIAPISAGLTIGGGNHASRLFLMLTPLIIISSLGVYYLFEILWKKKFNRGILMILVLIFAFNVYTYFHQYYIHYPKEQERLWHYGFKQAILKAQSLENSYEKIILTPTTEPPLIFLLFWTKFDPSVFQKQPLEKVAISGFGDAQKLNKFYIAALNPELATDELRDIIDSKMLVIANRKDIPEDLRREKIKGIKVVDIIKYPSGEVAFYLLTHE